VSFALLYYREKYTLPFLKTKKRWGEGERKREEEVRVLEFP
jgi:hypothetical protein